MDKYLWDFKNRSGYSWPKHYLIRYHLELQHTLYWTCPSFPQTRTVSKFRIKHNYHQAGTNLRARTHRDAWISMYGTGQISLNKGAAAPLLQTPMWFHHTLGISPTCLHVPLSSYWALGTQTLEPSRQVRVQILLLSSFVTSSNFSPSSVPQFPFMKRA